MTVCNIAIHNDMAATFLANGKMYVYNNTGSGDKYTDVCHIVYANSLLAM